MDVEGEGILIIEKLGIPPFPPGYSSSRLEPTQESPGTLSFVEWFLSATLVTAESTFGTKSSIVPEQNVRDPALSPTFDFLHGKSSGFRCNHVYLPHALLLSLSTTLPSKLYFFRTARHSS